MNLTMKHLLLILGTITAMAFGMEQQQKQIDYFGLITNDIAKVILNFIADQDNHDTQLTLENLQNLLICRQFNKRFCYLTNTKVQTLLKAEEALVAMHYKEDYSQKSSAKNINVLNNILSCSEKQIDAIYDSLSDNKKLGCALQRNLLVYIFDFFKKNPTKITLPLYYTFIYYDFDPTKITARKIYPITWAVYADAHESQKLLTSMGSNNTLLECQLKIARIEKREFDHIKPITHPYLKFLNPR